MAIINKNLTTQQYTDQHKPILIDWNKRSFDFQEDYVVSVNKDLNSQMLEFLSAPEYDGVDLYGTNVYVNYLTNWSLDGEHISQGSILLDTSLADSQLKIKWLLNQLQTYQPGKVNFDLTFQIEQVYNSQYYVSWKDSVNQDFALNTWFYVINPTAQKTSWILAVINDINEFERIKNNPVGNIYPCITIGDNTTDALYDKVSVQPTNWEETYKLYYKKNDSTYVLNDSADFDSTNCYLRKYVGLAYKPAYVLKTLPGQFEVVNSIDIQSNTIFPVSAEGQIELESYATTSYVNTSIATAISESESSMDAKITSKLNTKVDSVNGKTGTVNLTADDVGAVNIDQNQELTDAQKEQVLKNLSLGYISHTTDINEPVEKYQFSTKSSFPVELSANSILHISSTSNEIHFDNLGSFTKSDSVTTLSIGETGTTHQIRGIGSCDYDDCATPKSYVDHLSKEIIHYTATITEKAATKSGVTETLTLSYTALTTDLVRVGITIDEVTYYVSCYMNDSLAESYYLIGNVVSGAPDAMLHLSARCTQGRQLTFKYSLGEQSTTSTLQPTSIVVESIVAPMLLDYIHPIDSIWETLSPVHPSKVFSGGVWEQVKGRFLFGAAMDAVSSVKTYPGQLNGEYTHTLTLNEIPTHYHYQQIGNKTGGSTDGRSVNWNDNTKTTISWHESTESMRTSTSGSDQPHNNMPPYLVVYMWRRIT